MTTTMIRWVLAAGIGLSLSAGSMVAVANAAGGEGATVHYPLKHPTYENWSFAGLFGQYDRAQLQRGYRVYKEVCASCHSMNLVKFRNLSEDGGPEFSEEQVKVLAAEYTISDAVDENGDPVERPREPKDPFPAPFPNENAARAANGGALPPDMSLIAKARAVQRGFPWFVFDMFWPYQEQGPDYIHSLIVGYQDPPEGVVVPDGQYYNPYFINGTALAMAPPISDEQVEYTDGTPMTVDQYSRDVSAFLMWAAEPHLEARKELGFKAMIFLVVFGCLLGFVKRRIWADIPH
jgi:ubiquinol-cytochrome c reductase cytochrome c1 subunit